MALDVVEVDSAVEITTKRIPDSVDTRVCLWDSNVPPSGAPSVVN
jgi:hypothetical protein